MPSEKGWETKISPFSNSFFFSRPQTSQDLPTAMSHPLMLYKLHQVGDYHNHTDGNIRLHAPRALQAWDRQFAFYLEPWQILNSYSLLPGSLKPGAQIDSFLFKLEQFLFSLFISRGFNEARCTVSKAAIISHATLPLVFPCNLKFCIPKSFMFPLLVKATRTN